MNGDTTSPPRGKMTLVLAILIGVILIAASFLIGYTVGSGKGVLPGKNIISGGADCSDSEVLQRLLNSGYLPPEFDPNSTVYYVEGEITEVGSGYIEISAALSPIEDARTFRVSIPSDVTIVQQTPKDPEELNAAFRAFDEAISNFDPESDGTPPEPPEIFEEEELSLSDLKIGSTVNVTTDVNIRENSSFDATEISLSAEIGIEDAPFNPPTPPGDIPLPEPPPDDIQPVDEIPEPDTAE